MRYAGSRSSGEVCSEISMGNKNSGSNREYCGEIYCMAVDQMGKFMVRYASRRSNSDFCGEIYWSWIKWGRL